jgi:hypothetical protein
MPLDVMCMVFSTCYIEKLRDLMAQPAWYAGDGSAHAGKVQPAADACAEPLIPTAALQELLAKYAMPPRSSMGRERPMNILDPLQELNNLGRSVSVASHKRIVFVMKHTQAIIERVLKIVVCCLPSHFAVSNLCRADHMADFVFLLGACARAVVQLGDSYGTADCFMHE